MRDSAFWAEKRNDEGSWLFVLGEVDLPKNLAIFPWDDRNGLRTAKLKEIVKRLEDKGCVDLLLADLGDSSEWENGTLNELARMAKGGTIRLRGKGSAWERVLARLAERERDELDGEAEKGSDSATRRQL